MSGAFLVLFSLVALASVLAPFALVWILNRTSKVRPLDPAEQGTIAATSAMPLGHPLEHLWGARSAEAVRFTAIGAPPADSRAEAGFLSGNPGSVRLDQLRRPAPRPDERREGH